MAKKNQRPILEGAPEWIVTFADLMSLLVCFFVLIISFSIQDKMKLQVVAGSMREAFGVTSESQKAGMIENPGIPVRKHVRNVEQIEREKDTNYSDIDHNKRRQQGQEANTHNHEKTDIEKPRQFATAAASLRQAWQEMPEITEISDNIILEETPDGLNIQLIDQEGRAMFAPGSVKPLPHTKRLLQKMAPIIKSLPNRIKITGHTDSTKLYTKDGYGLWELTSDRANSARRVLSDSGVPDNKFYAVTGKADSEPLFPEDAYLASNRRISIIIMKEAPPIAPGHKLGN